MQIGGKRESREYQEGRSVNAQTGPVQSEQALMFVGLGAMKKAQRSLTSPMDRKK